MKTVDECPCSIKNEDYPYEGFSTRHKCVLKQTMNSICDAETNKGCRLFDRMQLDEELRKFIQGWIKTGGE